MSKIILTCSDGSYYADSVYQHSAWIAEKLKLGIHVLHMLDPEWQDPPILDFSSNIGIEPQAALLDELIRLEEAKSRVARLKATAIVQDARGRLNKAGIKKISVEQRPGTLVEGIHDLSERTRIVVLGKRGEHASFAQKHLGSNLERVIRASTHPVLVTARNFKPIKKILLAYDGGPSVKKAVQFMVEEPMFNGLNCHLLQVGPAQNGLEKELEDVGLQLIDGGLKVKTSLVPGEPEDVIAKTVKNEGIDLLIMGAYGHSRIRQFIVGSTTTEMIRTCPISALMFR
jgi:nucleotide-binding universal stress UspA family protein